MSTDTNPSPLVILVIDAADAAFLERWVQHGYLPTLASIMKRGCWGRLAGPEQGEFGALLSLFSGVSRSQHGYYNFRQITPGTYDLGITTARDTNVEPFWSHLQGRNTKVAILDAPDVYPMTGLPGIQLANWGSRQLASTVMPVFAEPESLLDEARRVYGPQIDICDFKPNTRINEDKQALDQILERVEKKGVLFRHLLSQDHFNLLALGFFEAHVAAHRFWKYDLDAEGAHESDLSHAVRDVYAAIDAQVGSLLTQLPNDSNVFIVSGFGMESQYPMSALAESFCRELRYQAAPEPGPISLHPLALARRMMPDSLRAAIGNYLPMHLQERLLADSFRCSTDWRKTTAFSIPTLYNGLIRVNLRDREPQGIVQQGAEYSALLDRIEADLTQLIDPQTGETPIAEILRPAELFDCGPPASLPDVIVRWKAYSNFVPRLVHPKAELTQPEPHYLRDSGHSAEGFIAAAGPSIAQRGAVGDLAMLDCAPTFLTLMDQPIPQQLQGRPIDRILQPKTSAGN